MAKQIETADRNINAMIKDFNRVVLKAASEAIPIGSRRQYNPYCSPQLENLQKELESERKKAEKEPPQRNHNQYQAAKARFQKRKLRSPKVKLERKDHIAQLRKGWQKVMEAHETA